MARLPLSNYETATASGFIKIHRSFIQKGWYKKSDYAHLFLHLILKAQFYEIETWFNGETLRLSPGQLVTGRKKLSEETGINESKIERILKTFEIEQQIEQVKSATSRLITIVNWDKWQMSEQEVEQRVNNQRTTSEHYIKNDKNDKNRERDLPRPREKWQTNPSQEEIESLILTTLEAQNTEEYFFRLRGIHLSEMQINDFWIAFKIQKFTGAKFYTNRGDCIQHFRTWIKDRDIPKLEINGRKQDIQDERTKKILQQAERRG